LLYKPF